uniref:Ubiquitin-like-conjugating enzyme ATG10 n=1 Tax=Albugo laibachii Nc14 TaxID=890382 RepID=F0WNC6_9STRA|nr:conserved hypothetical protein [Albugo laibachii Nc14]|eukprot:CCA22817.1 conserved hypothetical protein [Albugo laibachii Nc14]
MEKYSYSSYLKDCKALMKLSKCRRNDGGKYFGQWQLREGLRKHLPGNTFLVSSDNVRYVEHRNETSSPFDGEETVEEASFADQATLHFSASEKHACYFEFHIVYHTLYQSPVLYFGTSRADGQELSTQEILQVISPSCKDIKQFISIGDHPILESFYHFVHPCETLETMRLLLESDTDFSKGISDQNYLLSWLTLMQPVTGICALEWFAEELESNLSLPDTEALANTKWLPKLHL